MTDESEKGQRRTLVLFVALTFLISWSCWFVADRTATVALTFRVRDFSIQIPLEKALDLLGTCVPGFVALFLVMASRDLKGRRDIGCGLTAWRVPFVYYLGALGIPLLLTSLAVLGHLATGGSVRFAPAHIVALNFLISLPQSPLWEEIGWRGYLLPRVQDHLNGVSASLVVGLIWGLWHLPLRLGTVPTGVSAGAFLSLFVLYVVALSVILTWFYNRTNGSLIISILLHEAANVPSKILVDPDPRGSLGLFLWLVGFLSVFAVFIIWCAGRELSRRREVLSSCPKSEWGR